MFSKPKAKGGSNSADYYENSLENTLDEYYTKDLSHNDYFFGGLTEQLGVKGKITKENFQKIIDVNRQKAKQQISEELKAPVDFYDMPFSAPKSVSILYTNPEYRESVMQAWQKANKEIDKMIEQGISLRRRNEEGGIEYIENTKIMGASFEHYTNRYCEPDLHYHKCIMNYTVDEKGNFVAINSKDLFDNFKEWGIKGRQILAKELQKNGIPLVVTDPEKGFFEVAGLDNRELIDSYSSGYNSALKYCNEKGLEPTPHNLQIAVYATRPQKKNLEVKQVFDDVYKDVFTGENAYTPETLYNNTRRFTDKKRQEVFDRVVEHNQAMNFSFDKDKLKMDFMTFGIIDDCKETDFERLFEKNKDRFVTLTKLTERDENRHKDVVREVITTKENIDLFDRVHEEHIKNNKGQSWKLDRAEVEKAFELNERNDKFRATEEQSRLILSSMLSDDKYLVVRGLAGVGKTFSYEKLKRLSDSLNVEMIGLAPQGAQAEELMKSTGMQTYTINKFAIEMRVLSAKLKGEKLSAKQASDDIINGRNTEMAYDGLAKLDKPQLIVVDEAGLQNQRLFREIQMIAKSQGKNCKILYSGDDRQLKAVASGDEFAYIASKTKNPNTIVELNNVYRQKSKRGKARTRGLTIGNKEPEQKTEDEIKAMSEKELKEYNEKKRWYNDYKDIKTTLETMSKDKEIEQIESSLDRMNKAKERYTHYLKYDEQGKPVFNDDDKQNVMLITCTNAKCDMYNDLIHKELVKQNHLTNEHTVSVSARNKYRDEETKKIELAEGERIRFRKNLVAKDTDQKEDGTYELNVKNGTYAVITEFKSDTEFKVRTDTGQEMWVDTSKYNNIDRAYCITASSAQGATTHKAVIDIDSEKDVISANLNYVLATRVTDDDGLKIYTSNTEKYIEQASKQAKKGDVIDFEENEELNKYRTERELSELQEKQSLYKFPAERAEEQRKVIEKLQSYGVPPESAKFEIQNMEKEPPHFISKLEENFKHQMELAGLYDSTKTVAYKDGIFGDRVLVDEKQLNKIIEEVRNGERAEIKTADEMLKLMKSSNEYNEVFKKNYKAFLKDKAYNEELKNKFFGKRPQRLSEAEMKKKYEKLFNEFKKDFEKKYAKASYKIMESRLSKTMEKETSYSL